MPFTAAELMQMQDEVELEQRTSLGIENDAAPATEKPADSDAVSKEDGGKESEADGSAKTKEVKEGTSTGEKTSETKEAKEEVKEDDSYDEEELRILRETARAQKAELSRVTKEHERLNKILKEKGLIDGEDEKETKEQEELAQLEYAKRVSLLNNILEVMRVNPKYEDIDDVVSQRHFDDMVSALARYHVSQHGGKVADVESEVEREIWSLSNPYKYMYDMIKKYHPGYAEKPSTAKAGEPAAAAKKEDTVANETRNFKEQILSLQDLPGGGSKDGGGWTAAKIDAMEELELSKVPAEIYAKYMRGELP